MQGSSSLAATIRTASRAAARGFRHVRNKTFHGPAVGLGRSKRQPRERMYNTVHVLVHVHPGHLNGKSETRVSTRYRYRYRYIYESSCFMYVTQCELHYYSELYSH